MRHCGTRVARFPPTTCGLRLSPSNMISCCSIETRTSIMLRAWRASESPHVPNTVILFRGSCPTRGAYRVAPRRRPHFRCCPRYQVAVGATGMWRAGWWPARPGGGATQLDLALDRGRVSHAGSGGCPRAGEGARADVSSGSGERPRLYATAPGRDCRSAQGDKRALVQEDRAVGPGATSTHRPGNADAAKPEVGQPCFQARCKFDSLNLLQIAEGRSISLQ